MDIWNAQSFFFATKGQVGAIMLGVSPEEWAAMEVTRKQGDTILMGHLYRVTAFRLDTGTLTLDAAYEVSSNQ